MNDNRPFWKYPSFAKDTRGVLVYAVGTIAVLWSASACLNNRGYNGDNSVHTYRERQADAIRERIDRKTRIAKQKPSPLESKLFNFPEAEEKTQEENSLFYNR